MSVPLSHYLGHRDVGVLVICLTCMKSDDYDLEPVMARLKARGFAAEHMGIRELADHVQGPCSRCGGRRFETRPAWARISRDGRPSPGYS